MKITVEFNSLEEMNDFAARVLYSGGMEAEESVHAAKQAKETKKTEKKVSEPTETEETEKKYTLIEVRAALAKIAKTDAKKVAMLFNDFGANKLSDIKEEDYAALMEKAGE